MLLTVFRSGLLLGSRQDNKTDITTPYCQLNVTVPILKLFLDRESNLRPYLRLNRQAIVNLIAALPHEVDHGWSKDIEVVMFLYWLAHAASYRVVASAFAIPKSTVHRVVHKGEEVEEIGAGFARLSGSPAFHMAVGAIDGCHIRAVCDHRGKFLDICVGFPGSVHDARALKNSAIYSRQLYPPEDRCILGDGGYPCLTSPITIMTPYREPVASPVEARYNRHHSRARCVIERAFGMLKTRWRSIFFKALEVSPEFTPIVITCCVILHNMRLAAGDIVDADVDDDDEGDVNEHRSGSGVRLCGCKLTAQSCESLSSALQSSNCPLRDLDLTNNDLQDSGVKLLSEGLKSPNCQLEILRLSGCMVTEEGCGYVSSALSSNPSHLRELDLSYNHPGNSGVKLLSEKLKDPNYSLDKLNVDHGGESRITAGLKKYARFLTLDPNTANTQLSLTEDNRKVTFVREKQPYPDHPDRFDCREQVLCRESVCGRCYWEIEWRGDVFISVSYKSISRKGSGLECMFGSNDQSWSLICSPHRYSFWHNNIETALSVKPIIISRTGVNGVYRVGVYVDHGAGSLSFYSVSDTMSLIHTEHATFTQTLYPGFGVYYYGSSVSLCC
ncbi:uncharacterized protein [Garra rufa]|uniref:uncharacterized protein n=1 Tax=Garra rufa TaxID=137080 RepID=UPI003CCE9429